MSEAPETKALKLGFGGWGVSAGGFRLSHSHQAGKALRLGGVLGFGVEGSRGLGVWGVGVWGFDSLRFRGSGEG